MTEFFFPGYREIWVRVSVLVHGVETHQYREGECTSSWGWNTPISWGWVYWFMGLKHTNIVRVSVLVHGVETHQYREGECTDSWGWNTPISWGWVYWFIGLKHTNIYPVSISPSGSQRLVGLVVKASASRAEESRLRRDFFRGRVIPVTSKLTLQWLPCQGPGVIGSVLGLVAPVSVYCDWVRCKVWSVTSVHSVAARQIVWADPSLRYTRLLLGR